MVLVDPAHMLLKTSPVPDPLSESVLSLDDDIKRVLESTHLSEHDKATAYEQTLYRYLNKVRQSTELNRNRLPFTSNTSIEQKPISTDEKKSKLENRILNSLPKTLQNKGHVLLDHIKETSDLSWDDLGRIIHKGSTIPDTNISDLFHEVLRARKLGREPKGWDVFSKALKETNIPKDLIGNRARWDSQGSPTEQQLQSDSSPGFVTPIHQRLRNKRRRIKSPKSKQELSWANF